MANELNIRRLFTLIKNTLALHRKVIMMTVLTLTLTLVLLPYSLSSSILMYFLILYVGGFIVTSYAFTDMHSPQQASTYLMLPCSNLERFLSKWILTSVGYALATLLLFYLVSLLNAVLHFFVMPHLFIIFQPLFWAAAAKYICLQSLFLLGAISFKRYSFIKTSMTISAILFLCVVLMFASLWLMAGHLLFEGHHEIHTTLPPNVLHFLYNVFWPVLAVICWYLTYRKITNYELR